MPAAAMRFDGIAEKEMEKCFMQPRESVRCLIEMLLYHFPPQRAAEIAVQTVNDFLGKNAEI